MIVMTTVIEKNINPTPSAVLSVKLDPYKMDEARIIIIQIEMIFPIITFDKTSKIDAKMIPNVDIKNPKSKINFNGISKTLPIIFIGVSFATVLLKVIIVNSWQINKTKM